MIAVFAEKIVNKHTSQDLQAEVVKYWREDKITR